MDDSTFVGFFISAIGINLLIELVLHGKAKRCHHHV
jgi:hypothetical protein